jgi:predicted NBD/HSP70 family sugar kinase
LEATEGLAGEIGHVAVNPSGLICRCGKRGCLETVASPVAISRLLSDSWGERVDVGDLMALIASGDRGAIRAVRDAAEEIGRVLAMLVTVLNPELIIVGGDLASSGEILVDPLLEAVRRHALSASADHVRVVRGELGENAEVLGSIGIILSQAPRILAARSVVTGTG